MGSSGTVCVSELDMGATWRTQTQGGTELAQIGIYQDVNPISVRNSHLSMQQCNKFSNVDDSSGRAMSVLNEKRSSQTHDRVLAYLT